MNGLRAAEVYARWMWPLAVLVVPLVLVTYAVDLWGSGIQERTTITMLINLVLVVGLYVFAGTSGILSFGHMSFMAIGAYVTALVTIPAQTKELTLPSLPDFLATAELGQVPGLLVAIAFTGVVALVIGIPLMRLAGISAALSMFAFLLIVHTVANNWEEVTRGRQTMFGVPANTDLTTALVVAILAMAAAYAFQESRFGLRMRSAREDEVAAQAIGVDVVRERRVAFVISAAIVAAGGFLYAQFLTSFNPDAFYLQITFLTIAMLVVGGVNSLAGAYVGTVVVTFVAELLRNIEDGATFVGVEIPARPGLREAGLAAVMLLILAFRPRGITGGREIPWPADIRRPSVRRPSLPRRRSVTGSELPVSPPGGSPEVGER